jgi:hypothetical protein
MSYYSKPRYPECRVCPVYQAGECFIASSRILLYFYCPASKGFRPENLWAALSTGPRGTTESYLRISL